MSKAISKVVVVDQEKAAKYLGVSKYTVVRLAKKGHFGRKVGKAWRFPMIQLEQYVSGVVVSDNRGASNEQVSSRNA